MVRVGVFIMFRILKMFCSRFWRLVLIRCKEIRGHYLFLVFLFGIEKRETGLRELRRGVSCRNQRVVGLFWDRTVRCNSAINSSVVDWSSAVSQRALYLANDSLHVVAHLLPNVQTSWARLEPLK